MTVLTSDVDTASDTFRTNREVQSAAVAALLAVGLVTALVCLLGLALTAWLTMRALLNHALSSQGFAVSQADDGISALEWLALNEVDLVITDINMPRLDGFGLIDSFRIIRATRDGRMQEVEIRLSDWVFNAIRQLVPHTAVLELYQVNAVTEGTDAQATVSVRLAEQGLTRLALQDAVGAVEIRRMLPEGEAPGVSNARFAAR